MLALMLVLVLVLVLVVWQGGRVPTKPIYFPLSRPARWRWWGAGQLKAIFNGLAERNSLQVQTLCGFLHEKKSIAKLYGSIFSLLFGGKKFRQRLISRKPLWQQVFLSISKNFVFLPYVANTEEILTLPHEKNGEKIGPGRKTTKRSDLVKKCQKQVGWGKAKNKVGVYQVQ